MSFLRHRRSFRPIWKEQPGASSVPTPSSHRRGRVAAGYSSASRSPPEPASASPVALRMLYSGPAGRRFFSERRTGSYSVVSAEGSIPQALGLFLLKYVINGFTYSRVSRRSVFWLVAIPFILNATLGLNAVSLRFVLPLAACVLLQRYISQQRGPVITSFVAVAGVAATAAVSMEFAIACFLGMACYLALVAWAGQRRTWNVFVLYSATVLCGVSFIPHRAFEILRTYASGGHNFPIVAGPYVILLLIAVLEVAKGILTPLSRVRSHSLPAGSQDTHFLAIALPALCMLPAALGRCDGPHVFFAGVGVFLLYFLGSTTVSRNVFAASVIVFGAILPLTTALTYAPSIGAAAVKTYGWSFPSNNSSKNRFTRLAARVATDRADAERVCQIVSKYPSQSVSVPLDDNVDLYSCLLLNGTYRPEYYFGLIGVSTSQQVSRKVQDLKQDTYIVTTMDVQSRDDKNGHLVYLVSPYKTFQFLTLFPLRLKQKRDSYTEITADMYKTMEADFYPVQRIGRFTIYKRYISPQRRAIGPGL